MIAGLILSAGRSSRMGRHKALLPYAGATFLEHIYNTAGRSTLDRLLVVLGHDPQPIIDAVDIPADRITVNEDYDRGMLSSLQTGLREVMPMLPEAVVVFLVDHPRVTVELIDALIAEFRRGAGDIVLPVYDGRRGHPVLFGASLFDELLAAPLDVCARHVVRAHPDRVAELPVDEEGVVRDIDTPDQYHRLGESDD